MKEKSPGLFSLDAYGGTAPFVPSSVPSQEAAEQIEPAMGELQARVFWFISERGRVGATDEELIRYTGIAASTARPRRIELVAAGKVVDSGKMRKTRSGRNATVWCLKEYADA